MATRQRPGKAIPIGTVGSGLSRLGVSRFDLHDPYHLAVSLSWPAFTFLMLASWLVLNVGFAALYLLSPGAVTNARAGVPTDAFFFSIETLATVGYGVMAPATLYGHIIASLETVAGLGFTAIVTGLLFVRFSRPKAKIAYAEDAVIAVHNGHPTLMIRVANARATLMSSANARLFVLLGEHTAEGTFFRRILELPLIQSHLPLFVMPWTLMHVIGTDSPLTGHDTNSLVHAQARLFLTIEARDHVLTSTVFDMRDYRAERIRSGMRYIDAVTLNEDGGATADLTKLSLIEPDVGSHQSTVVFGQQ